MNKDMKKRYFPFLLLLVISSFLLQNCKKDHLSANSGGPVPQATEPNKFVWNIMHDYYLWTDKVPNLSNTKYSNQDSLNRFLNTYSDPEKLFYDLLYQYKTIDKWSFIVDNINTINNWISGTSKTTGMEFLLGGIQNSSNYFGFVTYVIKGSPADLAGIRRGDIFIKVNDQSITESNYQSLLFSGSSIKISFATIVNNTIVPNNRSLTVSPIQIQENPILLDTVYNVNGTNVGYLVYNQFNSDFDIQLNNVFKYFKDQGISQLILDLRYNGGGAVETAIYLASMIYSTDNTKVFIKSQYNTGLQNYFVQTYGASNLLDYFTNTIAKTGTTPDTPINSLGLKKIYFLTSENTASASELLINGLKPYMTVVSIGTATTGKYVGSATLQDVDNKGNVNANDPWVVQPIIVKIANSQGVTDYVNGLTPDINLREDVANLLPFGDQNETLLSAALDNIKGVAPKSLQLKSAAMGLRKIADSRQFEPFSKEMYIKKLPKERPNTNLR